MTSEDSFLLRQVNLMNPQHLQCLFKGWDLILWNHFTHLNCESDNLWFIIYCINITSNCIPYSFCIIYIKSTFVHCFPIISLILTLDFHVHQYWVKGSSTALVLSYALNTGVHRECMSSQLNSTPVCVNKCHNERPCVSDLWTAGSLLWDFWVTLYGRRRSSEPLWLHNCPTETRSADCRRPAHTRRDWVW